MVIHVGIDPAVWNCTVVNNRVVKPLPEPIQQLLYALPGAGTNRTMLSAMQLSELTGLPFDLVREGLWALRDQGLATMHVGKDTVARWSRA